MSPSSSRTGVLLVIWKSARMDRSLCPAVSAARDTNSSQDLFGRIASCACSAAAAKSTRPRKRFIVSLGSVRFFVRSRRTLPCPRLTVWTVHLSANSLPRAARLRQRARIAALVSVLEHSTPIEHSRDWIVRLGRFSFQITKVTQSKVGCSRQLGIAN